MDTLVKNGKMARVYGTGVVHCALAVADMHGEYPLPKMEGIEICERWDGSEAGDIIAEYLRIIEGSQESLNKFYITDGILEQVMQATLGYGAWRCPRPIDGIDSPRDRIIEIRGDENRLKDYAGLVAQDLIKESEDVGGDDTYYDYFPGYVRMFLSICLDLGMKALYEQTIDTIEKGRYAEDEDEETLPHWYEIKE